MFATAELKPNTIIGIYTGFVGTHMDVDPKSDSLFELGWFKRNEIWTPLVVDGNFSNDGTRFVNSQPISKINLKAILGVYRE
jgi:hypothetical protein